MRGVRHREMHLVERIGWLRAAVLGANDGIISTSSLILGVAAASAAKGDILLVPAETAHQFQDIKDEFVILSVHMLMPPK